ncbi:LrgB-like family-domain-containing protein [Gilbertella persicaria]|uniref:LrgB-like family-domain-containing protein n=1 Tax=Gilbertella persicaria TaxID=101096 RepID=UPI00221E944B|nr:LrgB-like family-domain-containing protein [Gilbertella persicaria]KAI8056548.1 LrgB-like family-domain-containing protein [Gilbertella persicaria]
MQKFPSNVAGMIVLFFLLMCANTVSPRLTDRFVQFLDPYSSFALRSMNIMFVPAFVGIVSNPPVSGPELGRMICVFIVGYLVAFFLCTFLVRFFRLILFFPLQKTLLFASNEKTKIHHNQSLAEEEVAIETSMIHQQQSIIAIPSAARHSDDIDRASCSRTLTGEPLQGIVHNASNANSIFEDSGEQRYGPLHHFAIWCMEQSCFDDLTFFILFCICAFIFLPLPYDSPAMPFFRLFLYFFMTILLFSLSCRLPSKVRMVIHPIILTSACVMAGIAYFERTKGFDIRHGVYLYKAGITFVSLVEKTNVGWPGGGDILSTAMDVSIISLAFNVYKSRPSSLREWAVIFMSIAPIAFLVMFVTPLFAHAIGCSPDNSLVWSSRSVTTAIGIVIAKVLDANTSIVTCIIIFTGICGPLLGPFLFRLARVSDDDYMTIGITMGSSSHGVGTAYLISKNSRASGMASLAFAIFGTIGVIVASIPTLSDTLRHLAGF